MRSIPVTTVARTLLDLAAVLAEAALEDALDSAIRRKRVDAKEFLELVRSRRNHGVAGLAALERLVSVRVGKYPSGSGKENRLRRFIGSSGLPAPVGQHTIRREDGAFVARVDFAYPDAKVFIEFDSYEHHSSRNDWENDLVRQNELVELGWLPIRITDRQLDNVPDDIVRIICRRLTAVSAANARRIGGASYPSKLRRG